MADASTTISNLMDEEPTYTLEQARALVPAIRATLLQLAIERRAADEAHAVIHRRMRADRAPSGEEHERLEARAGVLRARVRDLLDHLESFGIVVRDLEGGLVDIPTSRDGEPAWLCWRLADAELAWWHTTSEGFTSRRPI